MDQISVSKIDKELLRLLESDGRLSVEQIAVMLDKEVGDIKQMISRYEKDGIILGYTTLVDWDKTDYESVSAIIELKVSPHQRRGFDSVAEKIYNYPEVKSLYLMSGGFDLCVMIEGRTMKEVAMFVAQKLSPMESIVSTATHFLLKKYKEKGVVFESREEDERGHCL